MLHYILDYMLHYSCWLRFGMYVYSKIAPVLVLHLHMYIDIYLHSYVCMYVCMYVRMYIYYLFVYIHVYTYIYTCIIYITNIGEGEGGDRLLHASYMYMYTHSIGRGRPHASYTPLTRLLHASYTNLHASYTPPTHTHHRPRTPSCIYSYLYVYI
jgi:hypothetical protein